MTRLAEALNQSEAEPVTVDMCPVSFALSRMAFATSLQDASPVVAVADQLLSFTQGPYPARRPGIVSGVAMGHWDSVDTPAPDQKWSGFLRLLAGTPSMPYG